MLKESAGVTKPLSTEPVVTTDPPLTDRLLQVILSNAQVHVAFQDLLISTIVDSPVSYFKTSSLLAIAAHRGEDTTQRAVPGNVRTFCQVKFVRTLLHVVDGNVTKTSTS